MLESISPIRYSGKQSTTLPNFLLLITQLSPPSNLNKPLRIANPHEHPVRRVFAISTSNTSDRLHLITWLIINLSLSENSIPKMWKHSKVIPQPRHEKDYKVSASYWRISLLSPAVKVVVTLIHPIKKAPSKRVTSTRFPPFSLYHKRTLNTLIFFTTYCLNQNRLPRHAWFFKGIRYGMS